MSPAHRRDDDAASTDALQRKAIDWRGLVVWIAGILAPAATAAAVWAHGTLWAHDTRLTAAEVRATAESARLQEHTERDTRLQSDLTATLRRLEDKIDRLQERRP